MTNKSFEIESIQPFSQSLVWQVTRDYYQNAGIDAWRNEEVPHHMTSNSMVGKTYAELILGLLRDLSFKNELTDTVYILELGAGHGRLAFHILKHLEQLSSALNIKLPPYCYVVSDIAEKSLSFYQNHPQFKPYFEKGMMDFCYFDAVKDKELKLRHSKQTIKPQDLNQPIVVVSNYFFDSIPTDLFYIQGKKMSACSISLHSEKNPEDTTKKEVMDNLGLTFHNKEITSPFYQKNIYNELLEDYRTQLRNTYLFFPEKSFQCLSNLQALSKQGMMVLSMDKGFHQIQELEKKPKPELIAHNSFSIWVNYHAFGQLCQKQGGKSFFPAYSTFYLQAACLLFLPDAESYKETAASYHNHIDGFGPDDFNGIKRLTYNNLSKLTFKDLFHLIRLSHYDSTFFKNILPRIKQVLHYVSVTERTRLSETMHQIWQMYFTINEPFDLAYELAGIFYDLGFYREALIYFAHSSDLFGEKADVFYNRALCHYQLKEDDLFVKIKDKAKLLYPDNIQMNHLDKLDLSGN